jgi:hypothetical protein
MSDMIYDHSKHNPNEFAAEWKVRYVKPGDYYTVVWFKAKPGEKASRETAYREALLELKRNRSLLRISAIEASAP